jgi:hypothetical protein
MPATAIAITAHSGIAAAGPRVDRLADRAQRGEHDDVAGEVQRERRGDRRVDDDLVRKRDLPDQPGVARHANGGALDRLLRGEPRPQRYRDEREERRSRESGRAEDRREDEVVDAEERDRVDECPREARDAAEVTRRRLAAEELDEQRRNDAAGAGLLHAGGSALRAPGSFRRRRAAPLRCVAMHPVDVRRVDHEAPSGRSVRLHARRAASL